MKRFCTRLAQLVGVTVLSVFFGKILHSHSAFLHPGVEMDTGELSGQPDESAVGRGVGVTCDGLASHSGE